LSTDRTGAGLVLNPAYVEAIRQAANESPFPRHLPMRLLSMGVAQSEIELDVATCHLQPFGIVHGGVIAALMDMATFWAGFGAIPEDAGLVNVDLKLNYLAAVRSGRLIATGRAIRSGRTLSYSEATIMADTGELVAHGTSTLMVLAGKGLRLGVPKFLSPSPS